MESQGCSCLLSNLTENKYISDQPHRLETKQELCTAKQPVPGSDSMLALAQAGTGPFLLFW